MVRRMKMVVHRAAAARWVHAGECITQRSEALHPKAGRGMRVGNSNSLGALVRRFRRVAQ